MVRVWGPRNNSKPSELIDSFHTQSVPTHRSYVSKSAKRLTFLFFLVLFVLALTYLYPAPNRLEDPATKTPNSTLIDQPIATPTSTPLTSNSQSTSSSSNSSTTNVSVDGRSVPVTANGTTNETINNGGSSTTVKVQDKSSGSSNTSVNLQINSSSTTSSSGGQN